MDDEERRDEDSIRKFTSNLYEKVKTGIFEIYNDQN